MMSPLVVLFLINCILHKGIPLHRPVRAFAKLPLQHEVVTKLNEQKQVVSEKTEIVNINIMNKNDALKNTQTLEKNLDRSSGATTTKSENLTAVIHTKIKSAEVDSGTLFRGVLVIVVLSLLIVIYMALKTYYSKRNTQAPMVRKYGIRTRRSDIEMTPLPLEEDDDETLFEIGNSNR